MIADMGSDKACSCTGVCAFGSLHSFSLQDSALFATSWLRNNKACCPQTQGQLELAALGSLLQLLAQLTKPGLSHLPFLAAYCK